MNDEYLALIMLSNFTGKKIQLVDVAVESYTFEINELDPEIIPEEYKQVLFYCEDIMAHVYEYESVIVYIIIPRYKRKEGPVLIGLLDDGIVVDYLIRY